MAQHVDNMGIPSNGILAPSVMDPLAAIPAQRILTRRQLEILTLLHRGRRPSEIAEALTLTQGTVRSVLRDAYSRLGASGGFDALARARALGLIREP